MYALSQSPQMCSSVIFAGKSQKMHFLLYCFVWRSRDMAMDSTDKELIRRRDAAVRRALNTPPKPLKEMKKERKKRQDEPTASEDGDEKRT